LDFDLERMTHEMLKNINWILGWFTATYTFINTFFLFCLIF
jgi:hypothetical protein